MTAAPLDPSHRLDGAAVWASLPAEVRAAVGAAAVDCVVAARLTETAVEHDEARWFRVGAASERAALDAFMAALRLVPPAAALPSGQPPIPALLGRVCQNCGCSENDACPTGCGWAGVNLCTACAPDVPAPRAAG